MLLIHQRKSAGTSLMHTLKKALGLEIANDGVNILNSCGSKLHSSLAQYQSIETSIKSAHLHPTKANMEWIIDNKIKCVVLLRNPEHSFAALARHREKDNTFKKPNIALYFHSAEKVLIEFYCNWSTLNGREHILIIYYEELVTDTKSTLNKIFQFYGCDNLVNSIDSLAKVRFSGVGVEELNAINIPPYPTWESPKYDYNPDFQEKTPLIQNT